MLFAVTFCICRVVIGWFLVVEMYEIFVLDQIEIKNRELIPSVAWRSGVALISLFYGLNLYWMILIVRKGMRTLGGLKMKES